MTKTEKPADSPGNDNEKRAQTIMLFVITLLIGWNFNTMVQLGKDMATVQTQLVELKDTKSKQQTAINNLELDNRDLHGEATNLHQEIDFIKQRKK